MQETSEEKPKTDMEEIRYKKPINTKPDNLMKRTSKKPDMEEIHFKKPINKDDEIKMPY